MSNVKCKYFVGLHDLEIEDNTDLKEGIKLDNDVFLTNNKKVIKNLIPEKLIPAIGLSEYKNLLSLNAVVYMTIEIPKEKFDERISLVKFLKLNAILCQAFWLVKDNAVRMELGHLIYRTDIRTVLHSNYLSSMYTTHLGEFKSEKFNVKELESLNDLQNFLFYISQDKAKQNYTSLGDEHNRVQRAFLFIQAARCTYDIGVKVAEFCTAFECLFAVSTTELKHRLAEIIGIILGKDREEKLKIYRDIQKAYDLRSAVVHGDSIPSRYSKQEYQLLKETASNCDYYLREIYKRFKTDEDLFKTFAEKSKEDLQSYFMDLIFKD